MSEVLKPCPFCGTVPILPDGDGTQYEIECSDCGQAMSSVQICDLMTLEERAADEFKNYRYGEEFIERAKLAAIDSWNTRAAPAAQAVDGTSSNDAKLISSVNSLLALDAKGALSPHGIGGLARELLEKCSARLASAALAAPVQTACKTCCDQGEVFVRKGDVEPWMESEPDPVMAACPDCAAPVQEPDKASFHSHLHYHRARQLIQRVIRSGALAIEDPDHGQQVLVSLEADLCAFLKIGASPVQHSGCDRCGAPTVDACNGNGCAYLESGNGAPVQSEQEPVAWMDQDGALHTTLDSAEFSRRPVTPLYAAPVRPVRMPERKPIPDKATFVGGNSYYAKCFDEACSWNACLDAVVQLNAHPDK